MSLTVAIVMMILAWLLAAAAMLWGVLRIARRHHGPTLVAKQPTARRPGPTRHRAAHAH
ncbi:hypothetical protein [Pseudomonas massiliensis]|uniref:hypothetical protein n=1 Tax=Pseudomonas massiliensis TaxID=522492 RepID=UPI000ADBC064|nr:hypothetical protein [Pseudomonas massiliensis]